MEFNKMIIWSGDINLPKSKSAPSNCYKNFCFRERYVTQEDLNIIEFDRNNLESIRDVKEYRRRAKAMHDSEIKRLNKLFKYIKLI